jgi:phospholipid N-methyltransferase
MATHFLLESLRHPRRTGAIAPSSRALARALLEPMDLQRARLVVEYGPGTGVITREIVARLGPDGRLLTVEANAAFCRELQARFPEVLVEQATVAALPRLLERRGLGPADAIVSGIPWTLMSSEERRRDIATTLEALRPGGRFATFVYKHGLVLPSADDLLFRLGRAFRKLERGRTVWSNLPPAVVLHCER